MIDPSYPSKWPAHLRRSASFDAVLCLECRSVLTEREVFFSGREYVFEWLRHHAACIERGLSVAELSDLGWFDAEASL